MGHFLVQLPIPAYLRFFIPFETARKVCHSFIGLQALRNRNGLALRMDRSPSGLGRNATESPPCRGTLPAP